MAKANGLTRVSQFFELGRDQSTLDFVDVPIGNDVPVFLDPSRLRAMDSTWASECVSLLQHYFGCVLRHLADGNKAEGTALLAALTEKNEFHLGLSKGLSDGRAFGRGYAERVWHALERSKARTTGLLQDIDDTCLFIDGIGPDRISDAVCNILRGPFIAYTHKMCVYYGIPMKQGVASGPESGIQRLSDGRTNSFHCRSRHLESSYWCLASWCGTVSSTTQAVTTPTTSCRRCSTARSF